MYLQGMPKVLQDFSMMEFQGFCLHTRNAFNATVVTSAELYKELLANHCPLNGIIFVVNKTMRMIVVTC